MKDTQKIVLEYISASDRQKLEREITSLKNVANLTYWIVTDKKQFIDKLRSLTSINYPLIIQIISHGNGLIISNNSIVDNEILYSEILPFFRLINQNTNENLIVNLMSICFSWHGIKNLVPFKHYENCAKLFLTSIGKAPVHGAIIHSTDIYSLSMESIVSKITEMNENLNDEGYITYEFISS